LASAGTDHKKTGYLHGYIVPRRFSISTSRGKAKKSARGVRTKDDVLPVSHNKKTPRVAEKVGGSPGSLVEPDTLTTPERTDLDSHVCRHSLMGAKIHALAVQ
jgi:hypothetical protein